MILPNIKVTFVALNPDQTTIDMMIAPQCQEQSFKEKNLVSAQHVSLILECLKEDQNQVDTLSNSEISENSKTNDVDSDEDSFSSVNSATVLTNTAQTALASAQSSYETFRSLVKKDSAELFKTPGSQDMKDSEKMAFEAITKLIKSSKSKTKRSKKLKILGVKED